MRCYLSVLSLTALLSLSFPSSADDKPVAPKKTPIWPQWRGPNRDGQASGPAWPDQLSKDSLQQLWRVPLGPSYSGPIVAEDLVFTTETKNKEREIVYALDRKTGKERWRGMERCHDGAVFRGVERQLDSLDARLRR